MVQVKIFRVEGEILSPNYKTKFSKDVRATKPENALTKVYAAFGSHHRIKRVHIKISSIKEITLEETNNSFIRALSEG